MTASPRLAFLLETVELETRHLLGTDSRLFAQAFNAERAAALRADVDESERTVRDAAELAEALNQGHALVPMLVGFAAAIAADCRRRGLLAP